MRFSAVTQYVDVAQVTLYVFWAFFAGLIFYIRREDKREGYPLTVSERPDVKRSTLEGFPPMPQPKTFRRHDGLVTQAPATEGPSPPPASSRPVAAWLGAPLEPVGNPLLAGVGPGAWVHRFDKPDVTYDGHNRIVPLRLATGHHVDPHGLDPRGMRVIGLDGRLAGHVVELWIDIVEKDLRYLEIALADEPDSPAVMLPQRFVRFNRRRGEVSVRAILSGQFYDVPRLANPDQITFLEEDRIVAYYGAGTLYATANRAGPLL